MSETCCNNNKNYFIMIGLGAIVGGIAVAWAIKVIPKMMQGMMARIGGEGCSPAEM